MSASPPTGIFSAVGGSIESWASSYVSTASANLSAQIAPVVAAAVSLWVTLFGLKIINGEASEPIPALVKRALTMAVIFAIALGAGNYQGIVVPAVNGAADALTAAMLMRTGAQFEPTRTIYQSLDSVDAQIDAVVAAFNKDSAAQSWTAVGTILTDFLCGLMVGLGGDILLLLLGAEVMLVRFAQCLVLALGPVFIVCAAFEATASFFAKWLGKLITYVTLQMLIGAFLGLMLTIFSDQLNHFYFDAGTLKNLVASDTNQLVNAISILVVSLMLAVLALGLPAIAAGLGGGASISGVAAFAGAVTGQAISSMLRGGSGSSGGGSGSGRGGGGGGPRTDNDSKGAGASPGFGSTPGAGSNPQAPAYQRAAQAGSARATGAAASAGRSGAAGSAATATGQSAARRQPPGTTTAASRSASGSNASDGAASKASAQDSVHRDPMASVSAVTEPAQAAPAASASAPSDHPAAAHRAVDAADPTPVPLALATPAPDASSAGAKPVRSKRANAAAVSRIIKTRTPP